MSKFTLKHLHLLNSRFSSTSQIHCKCFCKCVDSNIDLPFPWHSDLEMSRNSCNSFNKNFKEHSAVIYSPFSCENSVSFK